MTDQLHDTIEVIKWGTHHFRICAVFWLEIEGYIESGTESISMVNPVS